MKRRKRWLIYHPESDSAFFVYSVRELNEVLSEGLTTRIGRTDINYKALFKQACDFEKQSEK